MLDLSSLTERTIPVTGNPFNIKLAFSPRSARLGNQVGATSSISSGSLIAWETMKDVRLLKEDTITLVPRRCNWRRLSMALPCLKRKSGSRPLAI
jgi:hypothetical protein